MEKSENIKCLYCQRGEEQVPLVQLSFKGSKYYICPQHIPVLIHNPDQLQGMLPDAENMQAG
jgi:hypothetical protein